MSTKSRQSKRGYKTRGAFGHNPWFSGKKEKPFRIKERPGATEAPETYHIITGIKKPPRKSWWKKMWEKIKRWIKQ